MGMQAAHTTSAAIRFQAMRWSFLSEGKTGAETNQATGSAMKNP
jgi:hypothetical protein